ncbi:MAG: type II toxin-antitoxin system RelE/ParE family toxin [Cyclobacteriaceae bacterium]
MAFEIRWTRQSIDDLSSIADFISKDSPYFAQVQIERLFERVLILETYPKAGRAVPQVGQENLRELIEGTYRVIYRIYSEDRIDIIAVHHCSRLLGDIL